jgi:hypothetical protein
MGPCSTFGDENSLSDMASGHKKRLKRLTLLEK